MSATMIAQADVPKVTGDPGALGDAGADLKTAAKNVKTRYGAVTDAWKGLSDENYLTPEAPAVKQSIPMVTDPAEAVSTNLTIVATALATASTSLAALKTRSTSLGKDVTSFRLRANAADAADTDEIGVCTADNPTGVTGWRADPALVSENDRLWERASQLQTDLDQAGTDLYMDLIGISAPDPYLPSPGFKAGVPGGNRTKADGPGASADSWSGSTWQGGNWYTGAGAKADAHLFDLSADGSIATRAGTFGGSASLYGGARADASANMSVGVDGFHGQAQAGAFAGVEAKARGSYTAGPLSADVGVRGMAGAEANAKAGLDVGLDGVSASAGVTAFAGAKAEADASVEMMGAKGKVGADVRAGIGVQANVDASISADEVKVKLDLGVALGVGAGVKVDLSFSPKEAVDDVKDMAGDVADFFGF